MKKISINFFTIAILAILANGCHDIPICHVPHYVNPTPRMAVNYSDDTLSIDQLLDKYSDLVDGDTIAIRGTFEKRDGTSGLDWGVFSFDYSMYLRDTCERDCTQYSVQFLRYKELWLVPSNALEQIPSGSKVILHGILRFDILGPGVTSNEPGRCEEYLHMEVLDYIIENY